ncbi:MAG TPA: hypothetical protein VEQ87_05520, partial [Burkholderiales bacterium]|nr:hypothetical protein [Burkholderiales bacterium]
DSFLGDTLSTINDIVKPFKPVVDLLLMEVDLGITKFKMIDIARLKLPGKTVDTATKVLDVIKSTIDFLDSVTSMSSAGAINFGTFHLTEDSIENRGTPSSDEDVAGSSRDDGALTDAQQKVLQGPDQKGLTNRTKTSTTPGKRPLPSPKRFSIPVLEDPASLLDFILDRAPVDLFYYDLPDLNLLFEYQKTYPVFPGLNAGFFGSIGASTNFDFGFDTRGLSDWKSHGFDPNEFWRIFEGFYLDDHGQENTDSDQPEVTLKAAVGAVASLGIGGLVEAGVKGGIEAKIEFDLNDRLTQFAANGRPVGDGKMYGDELISRLSHGPECLFDMHGQLSVFLEAFFWIGLDLGFSEITIFEASERFVDQIIRSFDHECLLDAPRDLADLDNGVLTLRYAGADSAGPHDYIVTHEAGGNFANIEYLAQQGYIDPEFYTQDEFDDLTNDILPGLRANPNREVIVVTTGLRAEFFFDDQVSTLRSFGTSQGDHYKINGLNGLVDEIDLHGGDGGDIFEITASALGGVLAKLTVDGGGGDDYIRVDPTLLGKQVAGAADSWVLSGGDGDDRIKLAASDTDDPSKSAAKLYSYSGVVLDGGTGNDTLFGHSGVEHIEGGDGDDLILTYGGADLAHGGEGNDYIAGGSGNDQLYGDGGNDRIFGSVGDDALYGGEGDDTLMGEAGVDTLSGDGGNDLLVGASGNDILFGGDGDDRATWQLGEGVDSYSGGAGADELQMDGFITDAQAFYDDPDNYIQDDGEIDHVGVRVGTAQDANGAKQALVDWTHGSGALVTLATGEVETLRLDAGRGADDFHIFDVQSTSLDSVRVSGGQTRGIIEEAHIARDGSGRAAGQDLALSGDAGDQFRLRIGNYGQASALITLVDDEAGHVDFQSTAIAVQEALRSLVGNPLVDVTYDTDSQKYKVSGLGDVADALRAEDASVVASAKNIQELSLVATAGTQANPSFIRLKIGADGTPTEPIQVFPDAFGNVDTAGTAQSIETALRHLTGNNKIQVVYGQNTYRVSGLGSTALELVSPPAGTSLTTAFTQQLDVTGAAGQTFKLSAGSNPTQTITVGANGAATASAIQSALHLLPGFGSIQASFQPGQANVAGEVVPDSYRISGFASFTDALTQVATQSDPVTATSSTIQRLALAGTVGQQFFLKLGDSGLPSNALKLIADAEGDLDTTATAASIEKTIRAMTGSTVATVAFDEATSRYVIRGLDASAQALRVDTSGLASNVTGSVIDTRVVALTGQAGQQFRLNFGPGGKQTDVITIGAGGAATAAQMQAKLRALLGGTSITVAFDAAAQAYNIDGILAPADAMVLDPTSPAGGATFTSAPGVDIFKVFRIGPDEQTDTVLIEGSTGADDYRVSSLQAVGVDGKAETSLRYEQLNGLLATTGQPLSYVVVDVFGLERHDYVRLDTFGGNDHVDATAVVDAVVSNLYLDGGDGNDRLIGSNLKDTADVIIGGAGNDRLTGGAGVDQFFENTVGDNTNTDGDLDTLIETRDADFWLSDTSLRIDDRVLHDQYGNEVEVFGNIFEAMELYGLDGANRFEISGWSDSGLLDGYKGGDTYVLELASAVVAHQAIFINDTGASGIDTLTFKGSAGADFIQLDTVYVPAQDPDHRFKDARWTAYGHHGDGLIIAHFNPDAEGYAPQNLDDEDSLMDVRASSLTAGDNFQVINYHTVEQVVVFGGAGNDTFISDSTAAQIDVYGNEGDDQFYIGSVLETEDVIVEGQIVTIVKQITDGAVFNNSSYYGGDDDDYFEVNHNAADINLFGDNGDDTFLVKALLTLNEDEELVDLASQVATVSGTFGAGSDQGSDVTNDTREVDLDTLVYVENANVNIDGGAGFDAVSLVGTVLSDTFYVYTEIDPVTGKPVQRIYGAGVKLQKLLNIERLQLLAGGGDDTIYLYGTEMGPIGDMVIKGGSGSDTVIVGGAAQTINLSFPANSDQFYTTVEGYQVDKDAVGRFVKIIGPDGLPFYQVRSLTRVAPFVVDNPARTTQIVMPASYDLAAFKAPVLIDGGAGLHDEVQVNLTLGTQQVELSDRLLLKKDVEFDDTKLHLVAQAADPLVQTLLAASGAAGEEARDLLNGAVESYIRFADRYDQTGLVQSLQVLTGAQTHDVDVPAGISYFNIQNTLVNNHVVTARAQLIDFATTFGLTLAWKDVPHPDPTRAAAGEQLHELLSIKKGSVSLAFEALHSETVVFSGNTKTIVKDLTAVTLKTTATLKAAFDAGAVTANTLQRSDAVDTLQPEGAKSRLHFSSFDTLGVQLSQLTGGSKLTIDNDLLTGRINVQGGTAADRVFIKTIAAETVVHTGAGDDTITVGRNGVLDGIGAPLELFGDGGSDQITIDDTADPTGRGVTLEQELLQHTTGFEQLSRITDALGLKNITATENETIAGKLEDAAVPYGQLAMTVDAADLTAYRDYAAAGLLQNLKGTVSGLRTELDSSIAKTVATLKDRDQALLENQIELYVRARLYESGFSGAPITDELLRVMSADDGMRTWLKYRDWDSSWSWSSFSTQWYIDWGDSLAVPQNWSIKDGLNEIKLFFQNPDARFAHYGLAGVSNDSLSQRYLNDIQNLLKGRSMLSLISAAYYNNSFVDDVGTKKYLLGGGALDDDELMWLYLDASGVGSNKVNNLFSLAKIYDEAVKDYVGSSFIYRSQLIGRGLNDTDLNNLYNAYAGNDFIRGFSWTETNYGKSKMIGSVGDFSIEVASQYRVLTPDVASRVAKLEGTFKSTYQAKLTELQGLVQVAIDQADYRATTLNNIKTKTEQLSAFLDPRSTQSIDSGLTAEAPLAKASVYNRLATGIGNGVTTLLGDVASLSQKIQAANFGHVADTADSTDFTVLRNEFNSAEYHDVRLAYQQAASVVEDFTLFNARYVGDAPRPTAVDTAARDIKRQDRAADAFGAFTQALQGTFNFDAFRTAFLTTQNALADFIDQNPDYLPNILTESRAGAQAGSLAQDGRDIAEPVAVNRIQADLFNAAYTKAVNDFNSLKSTLIAQYTVTRSIWWFSQTFYLDYTQDARYIQQRQLVDALAPKVTEASNYAKAGEAQRDKLNQQKAGYDTQRAAAEATVSARRARYGDLVDQISGQFIVLKELSKFAIDVLKESRPGQSAAGFVDTGSLIKELSSFTDRYVALPASAPAVPVDRSEFEQGEGANSVVQSEEHVRYTPVLSVTGFGSAIHVGRDDVEGLTLQLGAHDDEVDVRDSLGAGSVTTILAGGGDDTIDVGRDASLSGVEGTLTIDAQGGLHNVLAVDGSADTAADADVRITSAAITGLAPGTINYLANGGSYASHRSGNEFSAGVAISAGMGADHITIVSARADPAVVEVTQVNAGAGNDVVTILDATPRYLEVHGQTGNDTITLTQPASANPSFGGLTVFGDEDNDTITGGVQADVLVGGLGIDTIRGGAADDVIVGDHALILRDASYRVQRISTRDDQHGGDDHLFSSEGDDVVIGGAGADEIEALFGGSIILGDAGTVVFDDGSDQANDVFSTTPGEGARDVITGGNGGNIIIGGAGGDDITGGAGNDIIIGDGAYVRRDALRRLLSVATSDDGGDADDIAGGDGADIIMGGAAGDMIRASLGGDIILGDGGEVTREGDLIVIRTTDTGAGGDDTISGAGTGQAGSILVGGFGADMLTGTGGDDILIGDGGLLRLRGDVHGQYHPAGFDLDARLELAQTLELQRGGVDTITGAGGSDVILGGAAGDIITAGLGGDIILGDDGVVDTALGVVYTTNPAHGGDDSITGAGAGADTGSVLIGGAGADTLFGTDHDDVIVGDGAYVTRNGNTVLTVRTIDADDDGEILAGGVDTIQGGEGSDVILGGIETTAGADGVVAGDMITASLGGDIILGDGGSADLFGTVETTTPEHGGNDDITGGAGTGFDNRSILIGGAGSDELKGGAGDNIIVGDGGRVVRRFIDGQLQVTQVRSVDPATGAKDIIRSGAGNDVILGGAGGDDIRASGGSDIILGDAGEANLNQRGTGARNDIKTIDEGAGAADFIRGGDDETYIIGGAGADDIETGAGSAVILGDNGEIWRDALERVLRAFTTDRSDATAGADLIVSNAGSNVILAGLGLRSVEGKLLGDDVRAGGGSKNIILGDNGDVNVDGLIRTLDDDRGGDDVITAGGAATGGSIVLGGFGADVITIGEGSNVVVGDNGFVERDASGVLAVESAETDARHAGADIITSHGLSNIVLGGLDSDIIDASQGSSIILGDAGRVVIGGNIFTTQEEQGGDDHITSGATNTILGGAGADTIDLQGGINTVIGDNGIVRRAGLSVRQVATSETRPEAGGIDTITMHGGTNIVIGGAGGDAIDGAGGSNIVLGDNGAANFGYQGRWDIVSDVTTAGDADDIKGGEDNIILGGYGADRIFLGRGVNTVVGDNGVVSRVANAIGTAGVTAVVTSDTTPDSGGADIVDIQGGDNIVVGGVGEDRITIAAGGGTNIVLGDNGAVNVGGTIASRLDQLGGRDVIKVGTDAVGDDAVNTVLGGFGADDITLTRGSNTVLGDNGIVHRTTGDVVIRVETSDAGNSTAGADKITVGGGVNIVLGGLGVGTDGLGDHITVTGDGENVILGDNGTASFGADDSWNIESDLETGGAGDVIGAGDGTNTILGGAGADQITLGAGTNTVLGDNGTVERDATPAITAVYTTDLDESTGGGDTITVQDGTNTILGGVGEDTINVGAGTNVVIGGNGLVNVSGAVQGFARASAAPQFGTDGRDTIQLDAGNNVVLGDNGIVWQSGGVVTRAATVGSLGAGDTITSRGGVNVILGGAGHDVIAARAGSNIILGDNGIVELNNDHGSNDVSSADPGVGDADEIFGGQNRSIILGGTGGDIITGGSGVDIVLGDHGVVHRDSNENVTLVETTFSKDGGDDTIYGGGGDNILIGGVGIDRIFGGAGNEVIVGDNASIDMTQVPPAVTSFDDEDGGADILFGGYGNDEVWGGGGDDELHGDLGNDKLYGQRGKDVLIGDVGQVIRTTTSAGAPRKDVLLTDVASVTGWMPLNVSGQPAVSEATVYALRNADLVLLVARRNADGSTDSRALLVDLEADGNDLLSGGDDADALFGQRGDDTLNGDAGNDLVSGGTGNDKVYGGDGDDTVVGDDITVDSPASALANVTHGLLMDGTVVVPTVQTVPGSTPSASTSVLPYVFGYGFNSLLPATDGGAAFLAYASVVTDFGRHLGQVHGNDVLGGGNGNDTLVGDDQLVFARSLAFDTAAMDRAKALTIGLMDVSDDFSDLVHRQFWLLTCDDHDDDHYDTLKVDGTFTVGKDRLDGDAGNDVLIGDDSTLVEPSFTVTVGQAADFQRFAEGVSDAGDEVAHAVLDLMELEQHLRDVTTQVKVGKYSYWRTEHHIDVVLMGNDTINGGDGNDLVVGDDFMTRTATVTIVPGGVAPKYNREDAWQDADWKDCSAADWFDHYRWHDHDWHDHDHDLHWQIAGLKVGADVINAGKGDDLVYGDSLAIVRSTVVRGTGVSYRDFDAVEDYAEEAIESFTALTDTADYWLALQGRHHHDNDDDDGWCLDNGDDIAGGDGNDILFGQAGNDRLKGEAGDDWLIGGNGQDSLDGGTGKNKTSNGNENSSSLRAAVAARLVNWKDTFKNFGVPFAPFDSTLQKCGKPKPSSFDFL